MKTPTQPSSIQKPLYIFIDTCIIQDAGSSEKNKSEVVFQLFEQLVQEGYRLAISEFSIYENLQGLWGKKAEIAGATLGQFEAKIVSRQVLIMASFLQGLYHDEKYDNISDGDKIIAATTILENGFVLTRNHKDFPAPFFITDKTIPLTYKKGHHFVTLDLALYKPNQELISRRVETKDSI